jgi:hypothetical protein
MKKTTIFFTGIMSLCLSAPAFASGFPDYIKGADIEARELDVQYQYVYTEDDKAKKDGKIKQKLEAYYGLNDDWLILGGAKVSRDYKHSTDINAVYLGAAYQFIDYADYGFNASILAEYIHGVDDYTANELEYRLQADTKWGPGKKLKTKANLVFQNEFGEYRKSGTQLISRLSTTYKVASYFKPGFEWHAGYGKLNDISESNAQEHYLGPVVYGEFEQFSNGAELEYQIGWLPGVTDGSVDHAFKFLLEYEMNF